MKRNMLRVVLLLLTLLSGYVTSYQYANVTIEPSSRQLQDFKLQNPKPIGILTTTAGAPVDIRDTITLNADNLFNSEFNLDLTTHHNAERIPERIVHAKGGGAFGHFIVTNDVSQYTSAEVFNGIGKKTPLIGRFSQSLQGLGGSDLSRELKGFAVKFYSKEGNLDLLAIQIPVYFYRDSILFPSFVHAFKRNPRTNTFDLNSAWDFLTLRPEALHAFLWILSDYGIPNGWRKMDAFPIHTYELNNKNGDKYYARFNFRTEQDLESLTTQQAIALQDPDAFNKDLYNNIEQGNFPSWRVEIDVIPLKNLKHLDYNPFDVTRLWKNGTYFTVPIGRIILNRNPDNFFKVIEQSAFNPGNLVPGIHNPADPMFKGRAFSYRDTQNYRVGINHDKIEVNQPRYQLTYNRDGVRPVRDNMGSAPNYYPNSFSGPVPFVNEGRPNERLVLYQNSAVDLQEISNFYNNIVRDEAHKQRLIGNIVASLTEVHAPVLERVLALLTMVDAEFGRRVTVGVLAAKAAARAAAAASAQLNNPQTKLLLKTYK